MIGMLAAFAWADAVTGVIETDTGAWLCRT
jgi:hypothetical protein